MLRLPISLDTQELTEILTLLSSALEYECPPARTVDQSDAINRVVRSTLTLHSVSQQIYAQLEANVSSASELRARFAYEKLIFVPNATKVAFMKSTEVVWAPRSSRTDASLSLRDVDSVIFELSGLTELSSCYPAHRDFFVDTLGKITSK